MVIRVDAKPHARNQSNTPQLKSKVETGTAEVTTIGMAIKSSHVDLMSEPLPPFLNVNATAGGANELDHSLSSSTSVLSV